MKKSIFILLLLLLPIGVFAKSDLPEHGLTEKYRFPNLNLMNANSSYLYSDTFTYENGSYTLESTNLTTAYNIDHDVHISGDHYFYTCVSVTETSCNELHAVYIGNSNYAHSNYAEVILRNGETIEDVGVFYISDTYHKEGEEYVLDEPEEVLLPNAVRWVNNVFNKYFCKNQSTRCSNISYIDMKDENDLYVQSMDDDFVYGNGFDYENGVFTIKDIVPSQWPNYEEYVDTYTCLSKEKTCEEIYQITNFVDAYYLASNSDIDEFAPAYFEGIKVEVNAKIITIEKGNNFDATSYLRNSSSVWIDNNDIIKIVDDRIIPLKTGKATVLIQKDGEVVLLRIEVASNDLTNPNTGHSMVALMIIGLITLALGVIYRERKIDSRC